MNCKREIEKDVKKIKTKEKRYWLVKFAPFRTSWSEIVRRGTFTLRGVRSPAARNNLKEMRLHDPVLFYHSQQERAVVGLMEVSRIAYPDPTSSDPQWQTCDFAPIRSLARPVSLAEIKADFRLAEIGLVRQPRLAVMPLTAQEFDIIANDTGDFEQPRIETTEINIRDLNDFRSKRPSLVDTRHKTTPAGFEHDSIRKRACQKGEA